MSFSALVQEAAPGNWRLLDTVDPRNGKAARVLFHLGNFVAASMHSRLALSYITLGDPVSDRSFNAWVAMTTDEITETVFRARSRRLTGFSLEVEVEVRDEATGDLLACGFVGASTAEAAAWEFLRREVPESLGVEGRKFLVVAKAKEADDEFKVTASDLKSFDPDSEELPTA